MSLVTVSISGHRSREDLTIIGTHIANALIKGGARVERDFGNVETTWDVHYADTPPSLPQDDLFVTIEQMSYEPNNNAPTEEDDDLVNTQMEISEALADYSDEAKLGLLSYAAAEVIAEYAEGEDRDAMISIFAQSVEQDIQFHDDYEEDMAEGEEPTIGEVVDALADSARANAYVAGRAVAPVNFWRNNSRQVVNDLFGTNLTLYGDVSGGYEVDANHPKIRALTQVYQQEAEDVCADCGCAIHD